MAIIEAIKGNLDVPAGDVKRAEPAIMKLGALVMNEW